MSVFSDFRERQKVNLEEKTTKEKRYGITELNLRLDAKTNEFGIYVIKEPASEVLKRAKNKFKTSHKKIDTNIEDPSITIKYAEVALPKRDGLGMDEWHKEYESPEDQQRYGKVYNWLDVLKQIGGQIYTGYYTKKELLELVKRINSEKGNAKYNWLGQLEYEDKNYNGPRILDGKNIAAVISPLLIDQYEENMQKKQEYVCIDDEEIMIKTTEDSGNLIVSKGDIVEDINISKCPEEYVDKEIFLPWIWMGKRDSRFYGFTINAMKEILELEKKEKGEERYE